VPDGYNLPNIGRPSNILKQFSLVVYRTTNSDVQFLSKIDANIIGQEIDIDNYIEVDKFGYNEQIKSIYPEILKSISVKLEQIKDDDEFKNELIERQREIDGEIFCEWKD
jgi:hypothetical protein